MRGVMALLKQLLLQFQYETWFYKQLSATLFLDIVSKGETIQVSSSWVYLGTSSKAGDPGSTRIVSRTGSVCTATSQVVLTANLFSLGIGPSPLWCPGQCTKAILLGFHKTLRRPRISSLILIVFPSTVNSPLSLYFVPCTCAVANVWWLSV